MTSEEKKVIFASSLGTVFEWYDFYLYGSLAAIIAKQFFSGLGLIARGGLGVYLALRVYGAVTGLRFPWSGLSWRHIPLIAVVCSSVGAVISNLTRIVFSLGDPSSLLRDIALSIFGDLTGALLLLATLMVVRKSYLSYGRDPTGR
jgi:hypothetical protein